MKHARAILIDLDGTLVLTAGVWQKCESGLLIRRDIFPTANVDAKSDGLELRARVSIIKKHYLLDESTGSLCRELETSLLTSIARVRSAPGAAMFVETLAERGFKLCIVSNSPHSLIDAALAGKRWARFIPLRVSSDDVSEGKPSPLIFQLAAQRLGVLPNRCLTIEDSAHGVAASRAAGMTCIGVAPITKARRIRELTPHVTFNLKAALDLLLALTCRPGPQASNSTRG